MCLSRAVQGLGVMSFVFPGMVIEDYIAGSFLGLRL